MKKEKQAFFITAQKTTVSKYNNQPLITVEFMRITDGAEFITYIQQDNSNYSYWMDIVADSSKGIIVSIENVKVKKKNIINADCKPNIEYVGDREEIYRSIDEYLRENRSRPEDSTPFGRLFEIK